MTWTPTPMPWVSIEDVPHPTDGVVFLALANVTYLSRPVIEVKQAYAPLPDVHLWCHLP